MLNELKKIGEVQGAKMRHSVLKVKKGKAVSERLENAKHYSREIRLVVTRGGGCREGKLEEGVPKVRTFSYKVNQY